MGYSSASARNRPLVRSSRIAKVRTARLYNRYKRYAIPHLRVMKPVLLRYHGPVIEQFRSISPLFVRDHRSGDFAFSLLTLALSLALFLSLGSQITWVAGKPLPAQPGFWPSIAIGLMLIFSILNVVSAFVSEQKKGRWKEVAIWLRSLEYAGWFIAYVFLVPKLGYLPTSIAFGALLAWRAGYKRDGILIAAAAGLVTVVLFKSLIGAQIPGGEIYNYLPGQLRPFMLTYL
ncbi:tripartite tricarboxylate transporter TctB family protein [uncultured Cohaesibacter sp.]|uniref:tripartite tricarboxylate transporter TctB family protein n=1 Tax=uncultured Cohaesibacter sp. TaxID=1002546 RepID=UPI0029C62BB5|nr:tripartite tricarboxylate transporter TctB family protein [uncultured Cohaesibacter sp.]